MLFKNYIIDVKFILKMYYIKRFNHWSQLKTEKIFFNRIDSNKLNWSESELVCTWTDPIQNIQNLTWFVDVWSKPKMTQTRSDPIFIWHEIIQLKFIRIQTRPKLVSLNWCLVFLSAIHIFFLLRWNKNVY